MNIKEENNLNPLHSNSHELIIKHTLKIKNDQNLQEMCQDSELTSPEEQPSATQTCTPPDPPERRNMHIRLIVT